MVNTRSEQTAETIWRGLRAHPLYASLGSFPFPPRSCWVGGVLRDVVLGRSTRDLDISLADRGEEIAKAMASQLSGRHITVGAGRHQVHRVVCPHGTVDIWDRQGQEIATDLARRDLTVNSFALRLDTGELLDPHHGLRDLAARRLRATQLDTFERDRVRVLRLLRFWLELPRFTFDEPTVVAARGAAPGIPDEAGSRVREELSRVLHARPLQRAAEGLCHLEIFPHGLGADGVGSPHNLIEAARVIDEQGPRTDTSREIRRTLAWAVLVSAGVSDESARKALAAYEKRGWLTRATARAVRQLLGPQSSLPAWSSRELLFQTGELWSDVVLLAQATRPWDGLERLVRRTEDRLRRQPDLLAPPRSWVDGDDVQAVLGLPPGPEVGRILKAVERARIYGEVGTREEALTWLRTSNAGSTHGSDR